MKTKVLALALALGASFCVVTAQDKPVAPSTPPPPGGPGGGPGGPGMSRPRPLQPLLVALDLNGDGTIDADEIAKASESLKKLDKNGDGKITPDELRPQRPAGAGGPGGPEGRPPRPQPPQQQAPPPQK